MANESAAYFSYWGKALPAEAGLQCHLLPFHSLDVAAVGVIYLKRSPALLRYFCSLLQCEEDDFLEFAGFLLALHDLGKFSEAFQNLRHDLLARSRHPAEVMMAYTVRHDSLGYWLWREGIGADVTQELGLDCSRRGRFALLCWIRAVTGHHGLPPLPSGETDKFFLPESQTAASDYVLAIGRQMLRSEGARNIARNIDGKAFVLASEKLSWWFAGVTVLADWLGSNKDYFNYRDQPLALDQYWEHALGCAHRTLTAADVLPVVVKPGQHLHDLFPYIKEASPLQAWASTVAIAPEPQLFLLEDVTGAGKTEAAMMLSYRLMEAGMADGFFVGLPTMATANAMYRRLAGIYQRLFSGDASAVLAHGKKRLVDEFSRSVLPRDAAEADEAQKDETASARCSAWLADHNKGALLAPAGIGTIDQALLAVLHSKHQSLRLLGLFGKVLVVDEVHACDAYMQGILEVLLEFHASVGGSVILLSATLPQRMKQTLLGAFARGRQGANIATLQSRDYPLATHWFANLAVATEEKVDSRPDVSRTVAIHYEDKLDRVIGHVQSALAQDQCVGWIRNTVADAIDAYDQLAPLIGRENIVLFHARFALGDRLKKEADVLASFGPASNPAQRKGRLMIATQVAEQSLDVDFDVLLTDLAPIDRVLQRAGRLHRHVRDASGQRLSVTGAVDGRPPPCLWIYGPVWTEEPGVRWYGEVFGGAQYVYANHGQLWLSAQVLQRRQFCMPGDARDMIEAVFSEAAEPPAALLRSVLNAEGKEMADASKAQQNSIAIDGGYVRGDQIDWWSEAKAPSRLGEETIEVVLAKWVGGRLQLWQDGGHAYSTVKVAARWMREEVVPQDAGRQAEFVAFKKTLPSQGKWSFLLALHEVAGGEWEGQAWAAGVGRIKSEAQLFAWIYDSDFGLRRKVADAA